MVEAALDLLTESGCFPSMRQLARRVGVTSSALYHHFPSKSALLQTLAADAGHPVIEIAIAAELEAFGPRRTLERVVRTIVTRWSTPDACKELRLALLEGPRLDGRSALHLPRYVREMRTRAEHVFEEMIRRRLIQNTDPRLMAMELVDPLMMLRMMYLVVPERRPDMKSFRAEVSRHLAFFLASIMPVDGEGPDSGTEVQLARTLVIDY